MDSDDQTWSGCFSLAFSLAELFEKAMERKREREIKNNWP
jgi:hypothetical protein